MDSSIKAGGTVDSTLWTSLLSSQLSVIDCLNPV